MDNAGVVLIELDKSFATGMNHASVVLTQHAEAAAVLWLRRDRAVTDPHYRLPDLAKLDGQLEGNLDGLRVAEESTPDLGWHACELELRWQDSGEVFTAGIMAGEGSCSSRYLSVMEAVDGSYPCFRALISSLGWLSEQQAEFWIEQWFKAGGEFEKRVAIAGCAVRGRDPGDELAQALECQDTLRQARALRSVGELARGDLLPVARTALGATNPQVRFSAAWAVARLENNERANEALRAVVWSTTAEPKPAETQTSDQTRAFQLVLRRMPTSEASQWVNELSQNPALLRQAVIGTGVVGRPDSIPWLLQLMQTPALARVAGEAFTMIIGLDLASEKFDAPWPAGFAAGPTEDPDDDNVAMDEDENLPWPDAVQLTAWWQKHSPDFQPGQRYLCGQPLTEDWLEHVLRRGYQRQRAAAALELALLRPDQPLFNVRAPGHRQQELLGLQ